MATPRSFRVCTVGAGYFSHFHHDGWRRRRHADLIAVCDLDRRKTEAMAAAFGVERVFDDAAAMLDACRPDLVDIVTPPATHAALVGLAAEHGIDAVCQKPLAPTLEETREMVAGARAAGIRGVLRLDGTGRLWLKPHGGDEREHVYGFEDRSSAATASIGYSAMSWSTWSTAARSRTTPRAICATSRSRRRSTAPLRKGRWVTISSEGRES